MSENLIRRLFEELDRLILIDPHTHINPLAPASRSLADILGYHYYTELAHSAGLARDEIEAPNLDSRERVRRIAAWLPTIDNTIQYSWLVELGRELFGFEDESIGPQNWEAFWTAAEKSLGRPDWTAEVLRRSRLEAVFLTNDFDDPLEGFDTRLFVPCLRTDELVFHLARPNVRERLERASGTAVRDAGSLRAALGKLFVHFVAHGARACAISLPSSFTPRRVTAASAGRAVDAVLGSGDGADAEQLDDASHFVFWTLAEYCAEFKLPLDLMIGVQRGVYSAGVHQGCDLYDSRVSLIQYRELLNAFPGVTFPISVLASVTSQELASYSWIFPNVVTHGHWWYSNTPTFIEHDAAARLEAVPRTKQIGYYSDMYKLEFALPKFRMYKRLLAKILAERFIVERGWSEQRALGLGYDVLRGNVERVFYKHAAGPIMNAADESAPDDGRENLLAEATALVERLELRLGDGTESVVAGFRPDGSLSVFFAADPVYQFNSHGELRRMYRGGLRYAADARHFVALVRSQRGGRLQLERQRIEPAAELALLAEVALNLGRLRTAIAGGRYEIVGQAPAECDVLGRLASTLATLARTPPIAATPHAL